jgi:HEPN domain-containing protein
MVNVPTQVSYWREGAREDWQVACELIAAGRIRHGFFFAHLALEKLLKAHVCLETQDLAPRLHNLVRLSELAGLTLDPDRMDHLARMNLFSIEGRYPESLAPLPTEEETQQYLARTREIFEWLIRQL